MTNPTSKSINHKEHKGCTKEHKGLSVISSLDPLIPIYSPSL